MRVFIGMCLLLTSTGCAYERPDVYSRSDINAINAEAACKAQARNLLQVARCEPRR